MSSKNIDTAFFFVIRTILTIVTFYIAYLFVLKFIKPVIFDKICLTNTQTCTNLEFYQYKNNFIAKEIQSQIWFHYDGLKLYVYDQIDGICQNTNYVPVIVFQLTNSNGAITFLPLANECIEIPDMIINRFINDYNVKKENLYVRNTTNDLKNNIFNIIQTLVNNKITKI